MSYIIKLSISNLKMRRLRTWLTITGVMIGTFSMVIMLTAGIGAKKTMYEQLEMMENTREIHVYSNTTERKDRLLTDRSVSEFSSLQGVKSVYPIIEFSGRENLLGYITYCPITGVPEGYMNRIELLSGELPDAKGMRPELVIGKGTKELLYNYDTNLRYADTTDEDETLTGKKLDFVYRITENEEKRIKLSVSAETSNPYDYGIYTDLETLKLFLRRNMKDGFIPGQPVDKNGNPYKEWAYSEIIVEVESVEDIEAVSDIINNRGFMTENSKETLDRMNRITGIISMVLGVIGAVAAVVAVIGIINTMSTAVYDRLPEIGLLKMLGSDNYDISMMFLFESGLLGFVGGVLGVVLSSVADILLNKKFNELFGFTKETIIFEMPLYISVIAVVSAAVISIAAGAVPAGRAARVEPLTALSGKLNKP